MIKFKMELKRYLFFCFITGAPFLCNTAAPTGMVSTGLPIYSATEGKNISFEIRFTLVGGGKRYLCKEECKHNNIIIETNSAEAQNGRYHLRYDNEGGLLQVTIRELKTTDSGRYRCGVVRSSQSKLHEEMVEIRVIEAVTRRSEQQATEKMTPETSESPLTTATTFKTQIGLAVFLLVIGGCVAAGGILIAGFLILLYKWKTKTRTNGSDMRITETEVTYENWRPGSGFEESHYENLDPASMTQEPVYLTIT